MADKKLASKRGRQAPSFSLKRAIEMLEMVQKNLGEGPFGREAIAEALGYKTVSGSVTIRIGTLTHFGLLDRAKGGTYELSKLGRRILLPESEDDKVFALAEAASNPTLYQEIIADHQGKAIPQMFGNILVHRYGVLPKQRDETVELFREAMLYCGLLRNGVLHGEPSTDSAASASDDEPNQDDAAGEQEINTTSRSSQTVVKSAINPTSPSDGHQEYTVPLNRSGRIALIYLPTPVLASDLTNIARWATFMSQFEEENPATEQSEND